MLNITKYQGDAQGDHIIPVGMAVIKRMEGKFWQGCGEMGTLVQCWWLHKKLKIEEPNDSAVSLPGIVIKERKSVY
jgi:hypothetical protein